MASSGPLVLRPRMADRLRMEYCPSTFLIALISLPTIRNALPS